MKKKKTTEMLSLISFVGQYVKLEVKTTSPNSQQKQNHLFPLKGNHGSCAPRLLKCKTQNQAEIVS